MNEKISNTIALHQMSINELKEIKHRVETTESEDVRFRIETKHWYGYSEPFIAKNKDKLEISVYTMNLILDEAIDKLINIEIENKCRKENITNEKAKSRKSRKRKQR